MSNVCATCPIPLCIIFNTFTTMLTELHFLHGYWISKVGQLVIMTNLHDNRIMFLKNNFTRFLGYSPWKIILHAYIFLYIYIHIKEHHELFRCTGQDFAIVGICSCREDHDNFSTIFSLVSEFTAYVFVSPSPFFNFKLNF